MCMYVHTCYRDNIKQTKRYSCYACSSSYNERISLRNKRGPYESNSVRQLN